MVIIVRGLTLTRTIIILTNHRRIAMDMDITSLIMVLLEVIVVRGIRLVFMIVTIVTGSGITPTIEEGKPIPDFNCLTGGVYS